MADSNALESARPVESRGERGTSIISVGSSQAGGQQIIPATYDATSDKTGQALLKLAGDVLAPHVKAEAQRQFLTGVQQAQSGQALTEIIDEQPWYSQLFGPSSAALGARAYATQMQIAKWGADMERNMPKLAEQGPEEFLAQANAGMKQFLTGDAAADVAITSAFVEQMAPLSKRHTKEHYIYTQRQAVNAQIDAWSTLGDGYQQRVAASARPDGGVSAEDVAAEKGRLIGALQPFADQTDESYDKSVAQFLESSAQKGNFQVIKLFKEEGLYDKVSAERRSVLDRQLRPLARQALDQQMPQYAMELAMIVNDTAQDPRKAAARFEAFNAKVAAQTGVTETEMIPRSTYDSLTGNILNAQAAARLAGQSKLDDQASLAMAGSLLTVPGALDQAVATGLVKAQDRERAIASHWASEQDPVKRAAVLNASVGTSTVAKAQLNQLVAGDENSKGFESAAIIFDKLNPSIQGQYFDAPMVRQLETYNALVRAGDPPNVAFIKSKSVIPVSRENQLPEDEKTAVHKEIRKVVEDRNENLVGYNTVDDASLRLIETMTNKAYREYRGPSGMSVAVNRAVGQAMNNGLQIIGKHAILGMKDQAELSTILAQGKDNAGAGAVAKAFESIMDTQAKANGVALDDYFIMRTPDLRGDPQFVVEASNKDGKSFRWYITGAQVRAEAAKAPVELGNMLSRIKSGSSNTSLPSMSDWVPGQ